MIARANAAKDKTFTKQGWNALTTDQQKRIRERGSATDWYVTVQKGGSNTNDTIVCLLHWNNGSWQVVRNFTARTKSGFTGLFVVQHKDISYWQPGHKYYGASYTRDQLYNINPYWVCYVHELGYDDGTGKVESGQGFHGGDSSGGCIVLGGGTASNGRRFGDAEYIYNNVPIASTVELF